LTAKRDKAFIRLKWQWPEGCKLVTIAWHGDRFPLSPDEPTAKSKIISMGDYHSHGGALIDPESDAPCYLTAFTSLQANSKSYYPSTVADSAKVLFSKRPPVIVKYSVIPARNLLKRITGYQLKITCDEIIELPEIRFFAKSNLLPLKIGDGSEIAHISKLALIPGEPALFEINSNLISKDDLVKAFFVKDENHMDFQLVKE